MNFEGQYIGDAFGPSGGLCMVNLDREPEGLVGTAYLFPNNEELPFTAASLSFSGVEQKGKFEAPTWNYAFDGIHVYDANEDTHPNAHWGHSIQGEYEFTAGKMIANIESDIGIKIECRLANPEHDKDTKSSIKSNPKIRCWDQFQEKVRSLYPRKYLFRGQPQDWRLRTSFHRTRRSDLVRYWNSDIPTLNQQISHILNSNFDLNDIRHVGAFFSLIQHHGYPTPLLDWSYSAYVAAFFAYQKANAENSEFVRIYAFDISEWEKDNYKHMNVQYSGPHITRMETLAIENPRQHAQQGVGTLTSISDMEFFIQFQENRYNKKYIHAFDLPAKDRQRVLSELSMMGVTAASLFPGLDGACEALRGRFFGDLTQVGQDTLEIE